MKTKIEWTERVWNPITGCTKISAGCKNCYAERMAKRLKGRYGYPTNNPFKVTFHQDRLNQPFKWKKPSKIFVCSMGDLFHENIDIYSRIYSNIFYTISQCEEHLFLILTKRPKNMKRVFEFYHNPHFNNVWLGVTAENQAMADIKIPVLLQIPAIKYFAVIAIVFNDAKNLRGDQLVPAAGHWRNAKKVLIINTALRLGLLQLHFKRM